MLDLTTRDHGVINTDLAVLVLFSKGKGYLFDLLMSLVHFFIEQCLALP